MMNYLETLFYLLSPVRAPECQDTKLITAMNEPWRSRIQYQHSLSRHWFRECGI